MSEDGSHRNVRFVMQNNANFSKPNTAKLKWIEATASASDKHTVHNNRAREKHWFLKVLQSSMHEQDWRKRLSWRVAIILLLGVIIFVLIHKWLDRDNRKYSSAFIHDIQSLVEHASQWNALSKQDTNPMVRLMHCNYAKCCADVIKRLVSQQDLDRITGIKFHEFCIVLEEEQNKAIQQIVHLYPELRVESLFTMTTGWLG